MFIFSIFSFDTSQVTNMSLMFGNCPSLKELNLSNVNTNNLIDMSGMFQGCSSLNKLILPEINYVYGISVNNMFAGCSNELKSNISSNNISLRYEAFAD